MQEKTNNMAKIAKTKNKKSFVIPQRHQKKIVLAYYQLYRVFVLKNLLAGMTMGAASHNAIYIVRARIAAMDKNNPVAKYLFHIHVRHSKRIAKRIMTSKYRDLCATATPETRTKINTLMPKWLNFSLDTFTKMLEKYKLPVSSKPSPVATNQQTTTQPTISQHVSLLNIAFKQLQNQRQFTA